MMDGGWRMVDGDRGVRGMSSRLVASMIAASVMFGANGTLREVFGADSRQVTTNEHGRTIHELSRRVSAP